MHIKKKATNQLVRSVSPFQEFTGHSYYAGKESAELHHDKDEVLLRNHTFPPNTRKPLNHSAFHHLKEVSTKTSNTNKTAASESKRSSRFSLRCTLRGLRYISTPPKQNNGPTHHNGIPFIIRVTKMAPLRDEFDSRNSNDDSDDAISEITMSPNEFFMFDQDLRGYELPPVSNLEYNPTWGITTATLECSTIPRERNKTTRPRRQEELTDIIKPTDIMFPHMIECWADLDPPLEHPEIDQDEDVSLQSQRREEEDESARDDDVVIRGRSSEREEVASWDVWPEDECTLTGSWLADV